MKVDDAEVVEHDSLVARLRFDRNRISADALIRRVTERYCVTDVSIEEPDLESIIRRIYVEGYRDPDVKAPAVPSVGASP
jgi:ABC-2 type transport system ATP-binding protein